MSYRALYRKYRPQTFSDVVGQEHITRTLKNELATGKTVHAYLFTGTRGTGKTSCAKILAKAVNCLNPQDGEPCGECEMCRAISEGEVTDICEIDAASNNSVDDIRQLREQVNFTPALAKYRVYIIDEVHMLTVSAFNALLKTLEEPPQHVVFILATTEVHKLPATILSRCQRFDFRRIDPSKITERIQYIAEKEGLNVTDEAASLIASVADGGMRDALSVLDLCASNKTDIDEKTVESVCALAGNDYLITFADCIKNKDMQKALMLVDELHNSSVDMLMLLSELTSHYRDLMIVKTVTGDNPPVVCSASRMKRLKQQAQNYDITEIVSVLDLLQSSFSAMQSGNRRCEMELCIIKLCNPAVMGDIKSLEMRVCALERRKTAAAPITEEAPSDVKQKDENEDILPEPEPYEEENTTEKTDGNDTVKDGQVERWGEIISILKKTCPLIAGVLRGSSAYINGAYLLIDTDDGQFRSLINSNNTVYRDSIRKAAEQVLGKTYKLGPYRKQQEQNTDPLVNFAQRLSELQKQ